MLAKSYPHYLANQPQTSKETMDVLDKYSGKVATRVAEHDAKATQQTLAAPVNAAGAMRDFNPSARPKVLQHCAQSLSERREELAYALCVEADKPIKDSDGEVTRLI